MVFHTGAALLDAIVLAVVFIGKSGKIIHVRSAISLTEQIG